MEDKFKITFVLEKKDSVLNQTFVINDDCGWQELIHRFAEFLSADFGYSFTDKIKYLVMFQTAFSRTEDNEIEEDVWNQFIKFAKSNDHQHELFEQTNKDKEWS